MNEWSTCENCWNLIYSILHNYQAFHMLNNNLGLKLNEMIDFNLFTSQIREEEKVLNTFIPNESISTLKNLYLS